MLTPTTGDLQLNREDRLTQQDVAIAGLDGGGFVAVWTDAGAAERIVGPADVYAGLFDAAGRPIGPAFRVHEQAGGTQATPAVTALPDGGFVVAWSSSGPRPDGTSAGISEGYARVFDADGTPRGGDVLLPTTRPDDHFVSAITTLADGTWVVGTVASDIQTDWFVEGHRGDAQGRLIGDPAVLTDDIETAFNDAPGPPGLDLAPTIDGGYAAVWWGFAEFTPPDGGLAPDSVVFFRYDADGRPVQPGRIVSDFRGRGLDNRSPEVVALPDGTFVVAWNGEIEGETTRASEVFVKRIDATGEWLGPEAVVNEGDSAGDQRVGDLVVLADGRVLVGYTDFIVDRDRPSTEDVFGVNGRFVDATGTPEGEPFFLSEFVYEDAFGVDLAVLDDGTVAAAWTGDENPFEDVYGRLFEGPAPSDGPGDSMPPPPPDEVALEREEVIEVALLYEAGLGRVADAEGLNFWVDVREGGTSEIALAQAFLDSPEFESTVGDVDALADQALVEALYFNVLEREGDPAGVAFWTLLAGSDDFSDAELLFSFATVQENRDQAEGLDTLLETEPGVWVFG